MSDPKVMNLINTLTALDANWRHEKCWWCHFMGNFPSKIGSAWQQKGWDAGRWVGPPKGENGASQALCSLWSTPTRSREGYMPCFSMSECRKLSFLLAAPPNCMFHGCFWCQSALTLSKRKLVRKWAWSDTRITACYAWTCILESEKPTGPEIRYVKVILR